MKNSIHLYGVIIVNSHQKQSFNGGMNTHPLYTKVKTPKIRMVFLRFVLSNSAVVYACSVSFSSISLVRRILHRFYGFNSNLLTYTRRLGVNCVLLCQQFHFVWLFSVLVVTCNRCSHPAHSSLCFCYTSQNYILYMILLHILLTLLLFIYFFLFLLLLLLFCFVHFSPFTKLDFIQ